jgi:hypothetical protein
MSAVYGSLPLDQMGIVNFISTSPKEAHAAYDFEKKKVWRSLFGGCRIGPVSVTHIICFILGKEHVMCYLLVFSL